MKINETITSVIKFHNVYQKLGDVILYLNDAAIYAFEYVFGKKPESNLSLEQFRADARNTIFKIQSDPTIHIPMEVFLMSTLTSCRKCTKKLVVEKQGKSFTLFTISEGVQIGKRFIKRCPSCHISEHYGYYTINYAINKTRMLDLKQFSTNKYLMSTEESVFSMSMLQLYEWELLIGCLPFQTKSNIYNSMFCGGLGIQTPITTKRKK